REIHAELTATGVAGLADVVADQIEERLVAGALDPAALLACGPGLATDDAEGLDRRLIGLLGSRVLASGEVAECIDEPSGVGEVDGVAALALEKVLELAGQLLGRVILFEEAEELLAVWRERCFRRGGRGTLLDGAGASRTGACRRST